MSREYPSAVAAFANRLRGRSDTAARGPRLPNRRAVTSSECGPETDSHVRAAAAAYDRLDQGGSTDDGDGGDTNDDAV